MVLAVGELLHLTIKEVIELDYNEFLTWVSWIEFKNEEEEKAIKKQNNTKSNKKVVRRI